MMMTMSSKIDDGGAFISEAIWLVVNEYFDLVNNDWGWIRMHTR